MPVALGLTNMSAKRYLLVNLISAAIWAAVFSLAGYGVSHLLSEVEQTCDRVAIIHRGRTLATGPVAELLSRTGGGHRIVARPVENAAVVLAAIFPGEIEREGEDAFLLPASSGAIPDVVRALVGAGVEVLAVERRASTLEDFFLEVTGGETV